mmetsp:Transcript_100905/g.293904  ORF Transcript_100905/g.293904 Transcript_100905/m.293904 type:complete len:201 (+) Transcript_100905:148-750(+)
MTHSSLSMDSSWETFLTELFGITLSARVPRVGCSASITVPNVPAPNWPVNTYSPTPTLPSSRSFRPSSWKGMFSRVLPGRSHISLLQDTWRVLAAFFLIASTSRSIIAAAFRAMNTVREMISWTLMPVMISEPCTSMTSSAPESKNVFTMASSCSPPKLPCSPSSSNSSPGKIRTAMLGGALTDWSKLPQQSSAARKSVP